MSEYIGLSTDALLLESSRIRHEYHKCREEFYNMARHYYHQHTTCTYYKESAMIEKLRECEELKKKYLEIKDLLISEHVGVPYPEPAFHDALKLRNDIKLSTVSV